MHKYNDNIEFIECLLSETQSTFQLKEKRDAQIPTYKSLVYETNTQKGINIFIRSTIK